MSINLQSLSKKEQKKIDILLELIPNNPPELEDIWFLMDKVWDEIGCDNQNLDIEKIEKYYQHPVWLLNGLFVESHEISLQHRQAIADWIVEHEIQTVVDFGGGFGTLAKLIAEKSNSLQIDIYEPYPADWVVSRFNSYSSIKFITTLEKKYDCLVATDVLEHVSDPLKTLSNMIKSVNLQGYLIIANCFYPVMKCHLPSTFHLRYSFDSFTEIMGLKTIQVCEGSHATIYQKISEKSIDWKKIKPMELHSKRLYALRNLRDLFKQAIKKIITNPISLLS